MKELLCVEYSILEKIIAKKNRLYRLIMQLEEVLKRKAVATTNTSAKDRRMSSVWTIASNENIELLCNKLHRQHIRISRSNNDIRIDNYIRKKKKDKRRKVVIEIDCKQGHRKINSKTRKSNENVQESDTKIAMTK